MRRMMRWSKRAQQGAQQSADEAKRAADRLREATDLLGGAQKQQASGKLDRWGARRTGLSKEEAAQADRVTQAGSAGEAMQAKSSAADRRVRRRWLRRRRSARAWRTIGSRCRTIWRSCRRSMRDTARELAPTQPGAASSLRDALSGMDQHDLTNLVQRTADWLRQRNQSELERDGGADCAGLKKLDDQVRQAQQAAGGGQQNGRQGLTPGRRRRRWIMWTGCATRLQGCRRAGRAERRGQGQQPGQNGQAGQKSAGRRSRVRGNRDKASRVRSAAGRTARAGTTGAGSARSRQGQQGQGQGQGQQGQGQQGQGAGPGQGGQRRRPGRSATGPGPNGGAAERSGGTQAGWLVRAAGSWMAGCNGQLRGGGGSTDGESECRYRRADVWLRRGIQRRRRPARILRTRSA